MDIPAYLLYNKTSESVLIDSRLNRLIAHLYAMGLFSEDQVVKIIGAKPPEKPSSRATFVEDLLRQIEGPPLAETGKVPCLECAVGGHPPNHPHLLSDTVIVDPASLPVVPFPPFTNKVPCAACDRGDFSYGHHDDCPVLLKKPNPEETTHPSKLPGGFAWVCAQDYLFKGDLYYHNGKWISVSVELEGRFCLKDKWAIRPEVDLDLTVPQQDTRFDEAFKKLAPHFGKACSESDTVKKLCGFIWRAARKE